MNLWGGSNSSATVLKEYIVSDLKKHVFCTIQNKMTAA
jgi:hypothetical protein